MSTVLYSASGSGATLQGTTVGGSKPLHRFIKGQPKIVGIILLILGVSYFIITIAVKSPFTDHPWSAIPPGYVLGLLFIICGMLYVLTDHNPTKKTVTTSMAFSIVTILVGFWTALQMIVDIGPNRYYRHYYYESNTTKDDVIWQTYCEVIGFSVEIIFAVYNIAGIIIFIVMSSFAGAALRSTKSQAVVVMAAAPTETPAE